MNALLRSRFPELARWIEAAPEPGRVEWLPGPRRALAIDGVQLASRYDPRAEAELQARLVPPGARRATLYGFAQGEIVRVLLARRELEHLRVVPLDPSVARAVFARCDPADWLGDPRVELVSPVECRELAPPFAASPADLCLAGDEAARLRDLVVLELATPFLRRQRGTSAADVASHGEENERRFRHDGGISELGGTRPGATLCVAAAGPTLARHYEELRARRRELIAVDAALKPLLAAGVAPEFVVTQDGHEEGMRRLFDVPAAGLEACTLVYFPATPPEVLARWPGMRRAVRADPGQEPALFGSGSVVHPAVDLAVRLGARRIELFGADFATPGGQSHVAGSGWQFRYEQGGWTRWVLDGHGRRVPSLPNLIGYLRDLERYIARHPEVAWINRSRDGATILGTRVEEGLHVA